MTKSPLLLMFLASSAYAVAVPAVVAGPELTAEAVLVEAPIRAVTVYGDHAEITRRGTAPPGRGVVALRLPDLPGQARLDTLRVEAGTSRVVRVEAQPVARNRASIDQVEGLLDAIEAVEDALAARQAERTLLASEVALLSRLTPADPVAEHERPGAAPLAPVAWGAVASWVDARLRTCDERIEVLDEEIRKENADLVLKRIELQGYDMRAFSAQRIELVVVLDRQADAVPVEVRYLVPGARWAPVYRIERAPGQDRLTLSTAGQVVQTTGEDWLDVAVTLSTAQPGRRVELPELLTWTLGEQHDFLPTPRARRADEPQGLPMPARRPTVADLEEAQALLGVQFRVSMATGQVDHDADGIVDVADRCPSEPENHNAIMDDDGCPDQAPGQAPPMDARSEYADDPRPVDVDELRKEAPEVAMAWAKSPAPPPAPPAEPAPFPVSMGVRGQLSEGESAESWGSMSALGGEPYRPAMALDLFDEREIGRGPFGPPGSPAALASGLDYEYPAVTSMTLRSQPEAQVVPLAVETWPITPVYQVAPGLKETAYLMATVRNQGRRPVLGGPVNIFVGTDFVGQGQLVTTGAGGDLELPLGADEDLRVVRRVVPTTVTEGVFSKDEVTTYRTVIEVRNDKKAAVQVHVVDQVPLSRDEDAQVKVGHFDPKPVEPPDRDGLVTFVLTIAPGATGKVAFDYTLVRPAGQELRQR